MRTLSLLTIALMSLCTAAQAAPARAGASTDRNPPLAVGSPRGGETPEAEAPEADDSTTVGGDRNPSKGKKGKGGKGGKGKGGKKGKGDKAERDGQGKKGKGKGFKIDSVNPMHGVLVYGPKLGTHDKYDKRTKGNKSAVVAKKDLPNREINRKSSLAAGLRAGSLMHGTSNGESYSDLGIGLMVRFRPTEALGLQLDLGHHADKLLGAERGQTLLSGSAEVFVFPWKRLSPYALLGVTGNGRDGIPGLGAQDTLLGPHLGAGVEIGFSEKLALDLEARYIAWLNRDAGEAANAGAVSLNAGLTFHF